MVVRITVKETSATFINQGTKRTNMLENMIKTFFPSTKKENKTMANSTQYVV